MLQNYGNQSRIKIITVTDYAVPSEAKQGLTTNQYKAIFRLIVNYSGKEIIAFAKVKIAWQIDLQRYSPTPVPDARIRGRSEGGYRQCQGGEGRLSGESLFY